MSRLFLSVVLLIAAVAGASAVSIPHSGAPSIVTSAGRAGEASPLALSGVANCGTADILDVRMTGGCTAAPCVLRRGESYSMEVDFLVTGNREFGNVYFRSLVLREHVNQLVTDTVYLEGTKLVPGGRYTFNYDFTIPTGDFTGTESELRLNVFQNMNKPLCVVIPATLQ